MGGLLGSIAASALGGVVNSIFGDDEEEVTSTTTQTKKQGLLTKPEPPAKIERYARMKAFQPNLAFQKGARPGVVRATPALKAEGPSDEAIFWGRMFKNILAEAQRTA